MDNEVAEKADIRMLHNELRLARAEISQLSSRMHDMENARH